MKYQKEIDWLRQKGISGNSFTSEDYDAFTIGVLAKRLNEYASEVNGVELKSDKALHKHVVSVAKQTVCLKCEKRPILEPIPYCRECMIEHNKQTAR